jgi:hypothetical protein
MVMPGALRIFRAVVITLTAMQWLQMVTHRNQSTIWAAAAVHHPLLRATAADHEALVALVDESAASPAAGVEELR